MSVLDRRAQAVAETVARVREIEREKGVTQAALAEIKSLIIELAARSELFPSAHFPVRGGAGAIYRLAEDPDRRFALYASAGVPGKAQPPHNHTTWAVIAGVFGDEHNVFYERTDDRRTAGEGTLRRTGELTVRRGNAVAFLPDDFHTIEVTGERASLHLHMYGMSLENLPERIFFAGATGGACKVFPASPNIVAPLLPAGELKAMLGDGAELALVDVREEGDFGKDHLLFACNLPLSRLEMRIDALVPRRSTRVVLCDGDDGLAQRAAARLMALGYGNLAVLAGGVAGWRAAGFELFSGVNVPSKAFGEFIEHHDDTPRLSAAEIKAAIDSGTDMVILDSRPMSEYRAMNIPTGIDCPGAELVYRVHDVAPRPETLVVVNCAGRTRSIIGAQSLINAGIPNKVVALKDGTMGWHLAGLKLEKGQSKHAPDPTPAGRAKAAAAAARVARRFGVRRIDHAELARFMGERDRRSLYLLDVRTPEEYAAGHLAGSRSAPGGQLVQATDTYVATRNARLVLVDGEGVRATMTASWLIQMGMPDVFVLSDAFAGAALVSGVDRPHVLGLEGAAVAAISPAELKVALESGAAVVVDLDTSLGYRAGHIPGAWFAIRSRLAAAAGRLPRAPLYVMTSPDGVLARLAAPELAAATGVAVKVLHGGTASWRATGLPIATGEEHMADGSDDVFHRPYDRDKGIEQAMRDYLSWEVDLVRQIERDGDAGFRSFPAVQLA
jgi:rhodanese-related sulfurtransferase/predicted metal-dependent enzyme (double-stranded beta helix superfamily)